MSDNAKNTDFDHAVVIFTKPNCVQCAATERRLQTAGVAYTAIDLTQNPELVDALRAQGFTAAPVVQGPDGDMYAGYNPDRLKTIITAMKSVSPNPQRHAPSATQTPVLPPSATQTLGPSPRL